MTATTADDLLPIAMPDVVASVFHLVSDRLRSFGRFLGLCALVLFGGGILALPLYEVEVNPVPVGVRILVLVAWIGLVAVGVWYVSEESRRVRALEFVMRDGDYGWLVPPLLTVVIFYFTANGFSLATRLLQEWNLVHLSDPSCSGPCAPRYGDVMDFYTWHFLEGIPFLRVNETLRWEEPLVYRGALTGWLVLALKLAVIVPLVQAFRSYWKLRSSLPRVRIDAWPRIARVDGPVTIKWAQRSVPGYVFDVYLHEPPVEEARSNHSEDADASAAPGTEPESQMMPPLLGPGWTLWRTGGTAVKDVFVPPRPGRYHFQARWRRASEHRARASNTPRKVRVLAKS